MVGTMHPAEPLPAHWHALPSAAVVDAMAGDRHRGLTAAEAAARQAHHGPNRIAESRGKPWWYEAMEALTEPLVLLLLAVGALYAVFGEIEDALTIFAVIVAVAAVEVVNELRAKRAIRSLRTLSDPTALAIRDGSPAELPAHELVPGDLVLLEPGRRVPADLRLTETVALRVDESNLTGESLPVNKAADAVLAADLTLGDRRTAAFAGTLVVAGRGRGVVVTTGPATELGRIAHLTRSAREPRTPLQQHLKRLAGTLVWVALGFSVLVPVLGVLIAGQPWPTMLLTGLTLAFATIPEELPLLITIMLGLGSYRLARQQAIVRHLRAAEVLGAVTVVGTDKTGTLTENRPRVAEVVAGGQPGAHGAVRRLLEIGVLANDAQVTNSDGPPTFVGDPTEVALLAAAEAAGLGVTARRAAVPVLEEYPFDDARKRLAVVVERDGGRWLLVKGAPESVLAICTHRLVEGDIPPEALDSLAREQAELQAGDMAARGLRVLAFAERALAPGEVVGAPEALERELVFVGLAGLDDPPRREAAGAIATLQAAGVRVLMLTGDHPSAARAVAQQVGIPAERVVGGRELDGLDEKAVTALVQTASVFARITPEHKLRLVSTLQAASEVVAVTGDGVNDGPALRQAAVGVAMGRGGSDVAREAADVVLADDNFATIAVAIRGGRALYENLWKAVRYYLAAKVALVASALVATLAGLPVPFEPVQIIVLELFMDLGASVTFTAEPPEEDLMARPPRDPRRPFLDQGMAFGILAGGLALAAAVLVPYFAAWSSGASADQARTAAFGAWLIGHVVLAAHMRSDRQSLFRAPTLANRTFLMWAAAAVALAVAGPLVPGINSRLHLAPLATGSWVILLLAAIVLPSWWEPWKTWRSRRVQGATPLV